MEKPRVDYDRLAPRFDSRYAGGPWPQTGDALRALMTDARRVLDVGCGTGRWLLEHPATAGSFGLDRSMGMLSKAREKQSRAHLVQADANALPFAPGTFDVVYVVNALHHFTDPRAFIHAATHLLRPGGRFAIVGLDPRDLRDRWFIYDYFDGVWEMDLARFPAAGDIVDWMNEAGLSDAQIHGLERVSATRTGMAILDDPFLAKDQLSQLAVLSDEAYQAGMDKIRAAAAAGAVFPIEMESTITTGRR